MRLKLTERFLQELMQHKRAENIAAPVNQNVQSHGLANSIAEPHLGQFFQQYQQYEHFSLAVVQAKLKNDIELTTESVSRSVNMNFILNGSIFTSFAHLPHEIKMTQAKHNLLYINNTSGYHIFHGNQLFSNLHISLSEEYFKELCPPTSVASERLHTHMVKEQPVLASNTHGTITPQMQLALQGILSCQFKGAMQKLYMEAKVLELLALQLHHFELEQENQPRPASADRTLAEELKLYLHIHYLNLPGIKDLAKTFGTNEFRLKKVFREHVRNSIFNYAQQLRLQHAHELLREGEKTITEVAETMGYSHANHFSNAFRKQFGYAPSRIK